MSVELPEIPERWRRSVPPALVLFAIGFGLNATVGAVFHETILVGPRFTT